MMSRTRRYRLIRTFATGASSVIQVAVGIIFLFILVVVGVFAFRKFKEKSENVEAEWSTKEKKEKPSARTESQGRGTDAPLPPSPGVVSEGDPQARIEIAVTRLNASVLVREIARLRRDDDARREADDRARAYEKEIHSIRGGRVPEHLRSGDVLLQVDELPIENDGDALARFYRDIYPGQLIRATVERDGAKAEVIIHFREAPLTYAGEPAPPPRTHTKGGRVPDDLVKSIETRFNRLPLYYQEAFLTADERRRLRDLMTKREATQADMDFLNFKVMGEAVAKAEQEIAYFKRLEKDLADKVRVQKNSEFDSRLKTAEGKEDLLYELALWCRKNKLKTHEELSMVKILLIDPGFSPARTALGYGATPGSSAADGGTGIAYQGSKYTPDQLNEKLESEGYALIDGKWYRKREWTFVLDTVHKPDRLKWSSSDVTIQDAKEQASGSTGHTDPAHGDGPGTIQQSANLKFFAPKGASGTLKITLEAPGPIVEALLRAPAIVSETKGTVEVLVGETKPQRIYLLERGSMETEYSVTDKVKGLKKIVITVVLKATPDKMMQHARFLPSGPDSKETFVVRGMVGEPAPQIDKLFEKR